MLKLDLMSGFSVCVTGPSDDLENWPWSSYLVWTAKASVKLSSCKTSERWRGRGKERIQKERGQRRQRREEDGEGAGGGGERGRLRREKGGTERERERDRGESEQYCAVYLTKGLGDDVLFLFHLFLISFASLVTLLLHTVQQQRPLKQ